ncbi:MAG: ATP-binding cassette domain-containing protein [Candidatus Marinimicrobia bacterium]|nr:ATP-binding cassette domain-containing protein [Candidatus Neomarinimicrobiota bacterium]
MPDALLDVQHFTTTLYPDVRNRQSSVRPTNRDINLSVPPGKWVAIIGETGCGKSVFLQSILRIPLRGLSPEQQTFGQYDQRGNLIQPSRVTWNFGEQVVENALDPKYSPAELGAIRQRQVFYIPQNSMSSLYDYHNLEIELRRRLALSQQQGQINGEADLEQILARVPIENMRNRQLTFSGYSGGMKQLTYVQMLNLVSPKLVILDEPTTAVDVINERLFFQHLREYTQTSDFSVLLISHNMDILRSYFRDDDLVYVMYKGVMVEKGPKAQLFENPIHPYTQSLVRSFPSLDRAMTITQQNLLANIRYNLEQRTNLVENLTLLQTIFQFIDSMSREHQFLTDRIDQALQNPETGLEGILEDLIRLQTACDGASTFAGITTDVARQELRDFLKTLQQEQIRLGDDSCPYFNQCPVREQMCLHLFRVGKNLFDDNGDHQAKCISNDKKILFQSFYAERSEQQTPIISVENLSVVPAEKAGLLRRKNGQQDWLLRDISLSIKQGQTVGLAGGSGQGKSTFIKTLLQFRNEYAYDESDSKISYWNQRYGELKDFPRRVQYVPQVIDGAFRPDQTAIEILLESYFKSETNPRSIQLVLQEKHYIAERCLVDLRMAWKALNDWPVKWSGGEKQRLLIGRALIALGLYENQAGTHTPGDRLLILDEPTSSVDVLVQAEILNLLNEFEKRYAFSYLIVSHNLALLRNLCDIIYVIYGGEIIEKIRYDQFELTGEPWRDMHPYTHALFADRDLRPVEPPHHQYCVYYNNCNLKGLTDEKCKQKPRIDDSLDASIACWHTPGAQ